MPSLTQPLREEHQELVPQIERLRTVADLVGDTSIETLQHAIDDVYAFLTMHLIPHAQAEDTALYPWVGKVMGAAQATATMSRDHVEVADWKYEVSRIPRYCVYLSKIDCGQAQSTTDLAGSRYPRAMDNYCPERPVGVA